MNKRFIVFLCLIMGISLLTTGCTQANVNKIIHIEPSSLFQGDLERLEPHLGLISGLVKVKVNGDDKSIKVKYEIWEKGQLIVSNNAMSMHIDNNFNGEVSFSLKDDIYNEDHFKMCTVITDAAGHGSCVVIVPKFDSQFSHGVNMLNESINVAVNEEVAVWSLLANEVGEGFRVGGIEEAAKESDWALVLKISVQEESKEE